MTEETVQAEVIEDARTGEIIPRGSPEQLRPGILAQININQVGTLDVDEKAESVLTEPLDPKDVQIRPDGLVYLPWTWYNKRLNRAFGLLKWGLIPQGSPQVRDMGNSTLVVWLNWLVVKGVPVSMAGGETSYQPSNYTMSYGDAVEGARSNSLARNCKNLGMAIELWDAEWVSNWKKEYAETYKGKNDKTYWRKVSTNGSKIRPANPQGLENASKVEKSTPSNAPKTQESTADTESSSEIVSGASGEDSGKYTVSELRSAEIVIALKGMTGKQIPELMKVINGLDKNGKYSVEEVAKLVG